MKKKIAILAGVLMGLTTGVTAYGNTISSDNVIALDEKEAIQDASVGIIYEIDNIKGEVILTGYTGSEVDLVLPDTIDGLPLTRIGENAFVGCTSLRSVYGKNIKYIGSNAFKNCSSLTDVDLPNLVSFVKTTFKLTSLFSALNLTFASSSAI